MPDTRPTFRVGDLWLRLAEGVYEETGLRPLVRRRRSLFAGRTNVQGSPGVQNVRDEDLRWILDSFAGGEGQTVIDPSDDASARRFDRSVGIDLSDPGVLKLGRQMIEQGSTGAATTTDEASTWTDITGVSTIVNTTDRRINAIDDKIEDSFSLANGLWFLNVFGYENEPTTFDGSAFFAQSGSSVDAATYKQLRSPRTQVRLPGRNPIQGGVTLRVHWATGPHQGGHSGGTTGTGNIAINVIEESSGNTVVYGTDQIGVAEHDSTFAVNFRAKAGETYKYIVEVLDLATYAYLELRTVKEDEQDTRTAKVEVRQAGSTIATKNITLNGKTATQKLCAFSILVSGGPLIYKIRVTRTGGESRRIVADKSTYSQATMADPYTMELGRKSRIWMVDNSSTAASNVFYWDVPNQKWNLVGTIGAAAQKPVAMAHSENYEFILCTNDIVYHAQEPATAAAHTNAAADTAVGVTVGGNRLFILTESTAAGTRLYEHPLEGAPAGPTLDYTVGNLGVVTDRDMVNRMAGTKNGCVFFANQGPDCWIYAYDGSAGFPVTKLPTGFYGQALTHGSGFTWVGGQFISYDLSGTTIRRPAILVVDHSDGSSIELDIQLYRKDEESFSRMQAMQLYGRDLFVAVAYAEAQTPSYMRLWRVSLRTPIAAFLEQQVTLDETSASNKLRGLGITWQERALIWSKGLPQLQSSDYVTTGDTHLISSAYTFGLTEKKELLSIDVVGKIPGQTSVMVGYSLDEGDYAYVTFEQQGRITISSPDDPVQFRSLRLDVWLLSPSQTATPELYSVGVQSWLTESQRVIEANFLCARATGGWRSDGQPVQGFAAVDSLLALSAPNTIVDFEDRYSSAEPITGTASIADVQADYVADGEAIVQMTLIERP